MGGIGSSGSGYAVGVHIDPMIGSGVATIGPIVKGGVLQKLNILGGGWNGGDQCQREHKKPW